MNRTLPIALCLLAAPAAHAQATYPQMAYTQESGKGFAVYVANLDGSRVVKVATSSGYVNGVDLSPQAGKLAFADAQGLKIVSFTTTASSLQVQGVQLRVAGASISSPDFTPDGSGVMYIQNQTPSSFQLVPVGAGASVTLCQCFGAYPRWLAADRFVYSRLFPSPMRTELWSGTIASDGSVNLSLELDSSAYAIVEINDFDVSRTGHSVLMSANYGEAVGPRIVDFDLDSKVMTQWGVRGTDVHYSNGDAQVIYVTPHVAAGDYLSVFDTAKGASVRLGKKGSFGVLDARP